MAVQLKKQLTVLQMREKSHGPMNISLVPTLVCVPRTVHSLRLLHLWCSSHHSLTHSLTRSLHHRSPAVDSPSWVNCTSSWGSTMRLSKFYCESIRFWTRWFVGQCFLANDRNSVLMGLRCADRTPGVSTTLPRATMLAKYCFFKVR